MVYSDFVFGGLTVDNSDGHSEDFPVELIKGVSLWLFEITMLRLADFFKLGEYIGCIEVTPLGVTKIAIKGITEATILYRKELCDEYSPLGISEWISEGVK